ncbi:MAG: hypothetical protein ACP5M5_09930 [Acidibrevibacterium sp.]|uniref:hypothetical protein n=1 Tax=Acidibrevibacterium sp. TaxID=2606776 RepID=UPI003D086F09
MPETATHPRLRLSALAAAVTLLVATRLLAAAPDSFLARLHHHVTLASTVPENGDQNPYAIAVAPVSVGKIQKNDILVDNFNDKNNLQGLGTTIVRYRPGDKSVALFASLPRDLAGCPGGVGLTAAMAMLRSGHVIVGSLPSHDGTTATKGQGCLIALSPEGAVETVITGAHINGPWGNMAVIDRGDSATLFLSNTGFDVGAPSDDAPVVHKASVLRLDLALTPGKAPAVTRETVIGEGFGEQADKGVFVIGPTGLALGADGTLYVSDAIGNRITAIADAATRTSSAGTGREVTKDGLLKRPLALAMTPGGHLLVTNGLNGQVVEIDPESGRQLGAQWIDADKAQTPPGNGDLFGLALTPEGDGLYYVEDDMNTLVLAR